MRQESNSTQQLVQNITRFILGTQENLPEPVKDRFVANPTNAPLTHKSYAFTQNFMMLFAAGFAIKLINDNFNAEQREYCLAQSENFSITNCFDSFEFDNKLITAIVTIAVVEIICILTNLAARNIIPNSYKAGTLSTNISQDLLHTSRNPDLSLESRTISPYWHNPILRTILLQNIRYVSTAATYPILATVDNEIAGILAMSVTKSFLDPLLAEIIVKIADIARPQAPERVFSERLLNQLSDEQSQKLFEEVNQHLASKPPLYTKELLSRIIGNACFFLIVQGMDTPNPLINGAKWGATALTTLMANEIVRQFPYNRLLCNSSEAETPGVTRLELAIVNNTTNLASASLALPTPPPIARSSSAQSLQNKTHNIETGTSL